MDSKRFKHGVASFYVIAFSTLILMIIVASFTTLVIAQITRSSNDDLAQSAYDSALAGVEDAKLAFYNYQTCLAQGTKRGGTKPSGKSGPMNCENIVWLIEHSRIDGYNDIIAAGIDPCDVVPLILGRSVSDENGVAVNEGSENNMQQYYTCAKINTRLNYYGATLSTANPMKAITPKFADGVTADQITRIGVTWGVGLGVDEVNEWRGDFTNTSNDHASPPAITFALVQAGDSFSMSDFMKAEGSIMDNNGKTNRGMVYLIPSFGSGNMEVPSGYLGKSNDKIPSNEPIYVLCEETGVCSVDINLPETVNGNRNDENFIVATALAYGARADIELTFYCGDTTCGAQEIVYNEDGSISSEDTDQASLNAMQIAVDSTGRANDLYRRVEALLEGADSYAMSIMGPLELTNEGGSGGGSSSGGGSGEGALNKDLTVNCEYNFDEKTGSTCMVDPNK